MEDEKTITITINSKRLSTFEFNSLIRALSELQIIGYSNIELYQKYNPIILVGRLSDLSELALNTYKHWEEHNKIRSIGILK